MRTLVPKTRERAGARASSASRRASNLWWLAALTSNLPLEVSRFPDSRSHARRHDPQQRSTWYEFQVEEGRCTPSRLLRSAVLIVISRRGSRNPYLPLPPKTTLGSSALFSWGVSKPPSEVAVGFLYPPADLNTGLRISCERLRTFFAAIRFLSS